jgi:tetratricopeptide (TPR) repeat protein
MLTRGEGDQRPAGYRPAKRVVNGSLIAAVLLASVAACAVISLAAQKRAGSALDERQIEGLLKGGVYSGRIARLVEERGIDFTPTEGLLRTLRDEGAQEELIRALRAAKAPAGAARSSENRPAPAEHRGDALNSERARLASEITLGQQLERQQMWPQAEQQYRAALNLDPDSALVHLGLGRVLAAENQRQEAIDQYRAAIRLQPDIASSHTALGDLLMETGAEKGAIAEYNEAIRLDPNDAGMRGKTAAILYSEGNVKAAIAEYRDLEGLQPNDPDVHYWLGRALYAGSDLQDAVAEFRQALRLKPDFSQVHAALGDALLKEGDRRGALEEYRKSVDSGDPTLQATFDWLAKNLAN